MFDCTIKIIRISLFSLSAADGSSGFKAEKGRYHLYVAFACPWAHRGLVARKLKGLEDVVSLTVLDWFQGDEGWRFADQVNDYRDYKIYIFFVVDIWREDVGARRDLNWEPPVI